MAHGTDIKVRALAFVLNFDMCAVSELNIKQCNLGDFFNKKIRTTQTCCPYF